MLLPLSFSTFPPYPIAVISLILLFNSWQGIAARQAFWRGFLFSVGMFSVGIPWVYIAIHDFGHTNIFLASLLTIIFISFLSLYLAILAWIIKCIAGLLSTHLDIVTTLPVAWIEFESFKAWFFLTGFHWLELGIGQINGPLAGYTPIIGVLGVSWLVTLTAGLLLVAVKSQQWWIILLISMIRTGGHTLKFYRWTENKGQTITVSLIQGNIPQKIRWDPKRLFKTLNLYRTGTELNWNSNLIIWPENTVPIFYYQAKDNFLNPLFALARNKENDILLGIPIMQQDSSHDFNSITNSGTKELFDNKRHFVPFGDYIQLKWLRHLIQIFNLPMSNFIPGNNDQKLLQATGLDIGISICYEDAFSTEVLATVPQASLLINASNNSWYGNSLAPHQHLQISRNRALDTGRPDLRATTNSISALINHHGQIMNKTPQFKQAILTGVIQPRKGTTTYVKHRQTPVLIITLCILLVWAYYRQISYLKQVI
ncbi:MAG: apolipoprotein N-acyltransferase [Piscirickettsiaceae bacterium]|nr:apolipoprotein N-acyltransferase [Piscirickettsiaceae bacterium]